MQNSDKKNTVKNGKLKGRALSVYLDLCRYVDTLPAGSPLPSLRELQRRYTAGQQTVTAALRHLAETRAVSCSPRRKARLYQASSVPGNQHTSSRSGGMQHHDATVVLGIDCMLAPVWQTVIERFNESSSRPVRPHYTKNLSELTELAQRGEVDFTLFQVNPISQGLLGTTLPFVELKEFIKTIDTKKFYPPFRIVDPDGRNWGISAALSSIVIFGNRRLASLPCGDFTWPDLLPYLREIKNSRTDLLYPFAFNGYSTFLMHEGVKMVDPDTGRLSLSVENFSGALQLLKDILEEGIAPLYSETYHDRSGLRWFENGEIASREAFHSTVKNFMALYPEFDLVPMPVAKGVKRSIYSEFFSICAGSIYYNTAWDFIKFVLSPEIQRFLITENTMMPVLRGLRPPHISQEQFDVFSETLNESAAPLEEYFLPVPVRLIIETEIDRWIRFGGRIDEMLHNAEKSCLQRMSCIKVFSR